MTGHDSTVSLFVLYFMFFYWFLSYAALLSGLASLPQLLASFCCPNHGGFAASWQACEHWVNRDSHWYSQETKRRSLFALGRSGFVSAAFFCWKAVVGWCTCAERAMWASARDWFLAVAQKENRCGDRKDRRTWHQLEAVAGSDCILASRIEGAAHVFIVIAPRPLINTHIYIYIYLHTDTVNQRHSLMFSRAKVAPPLLIFCIDHRGRDIAMEVPWHDPRGAPHTQTWTTEFTQWYWLVLSQFQQIQWTLDLGIAFFACVKIE